MLETEQLEDTSETSAFVGRPQRLSIVVYSKELDKVHYAFAMASAAAAINIPSTLLFTMGAIQALVETDGQPGWMAMTTAAGQMGAYLDKDYRERGIAAFEELIEACSALGVHIMVCEMGLRAMGLGRQDLRNDIEISEGGLVTFFSDAGDSPITFL
jgi:peroxiredoxin family protein